MCKCVCLSQSQSFASFSVFLNVSSLPSSKILKSLGFCVYESFDSFKCLKSWRSPYLTQITAITAGSRPRAWEGRTETPRAPGVSRKGRILSQTYTYTTDIFRFINVLPVKQRERREASFYFHLMGELKRLMLDIIEQAYIIGSFCVSLANKTERNGNIWSLKTQHQDEFRLTAYYRLS